MPPTQWGRREVSQRNGTSNRDVPAPPLHRRNSLGRRGAYTAFTPPLVVKSRLGRPKYRQSSLLAGTALAHTGAPKHEPSDLCQNPAQPPQPQIGRASCRERG